MVPGLTSWPTWPRYSPVWKAAPHTRSKNCTVISTTTSFSPLGDFHPRPRRRDQINRRSRCASAEEGCWQTVPAEKATHTPVVIKDMMLVATFPGPFKLFVRRPPLSPPLSQSSVHLLVIAADPGLWLCLELRQARMNVPNQEWPGLAGWDRLSVGPTHTATHSH